MVTLLIQAERLMQQIILAMVPLQQEVAMLTLPLQGSTLLTLQQRMSPLILVQPIMFQELRAQE
jgi:hypothetical protein